MTKTAREQRRRWWSATDPCGKRTFGHRSLIEQFDVNDPDAPHVILNLVRVNDAWELRSLSLRTINTLRILWASFRFGRQTDDRRIVTFTVSKTVVEHCEWQIGSSKGCRCGARILAVRYSRACEGNHA
jgi:hypothetical protein